MGNLRQEPAPGPIWPPRAGKEAVGWHVPTLYIAPQGAQHACWEALPILYASLLSQIFLSQYH